MKRFVPRLTYANVVATLALVIAVGGASAFAASRLPKNSVGTKQLKNNAITGAKIRNGAVSGAKIDLASLGTVPSAASAARATSADTATRAVSAESATRAGSADTASTAANANALGGLPPSAFAGSAEIVSGRGSYLGVTPQTIISLAGGFSISSQPGSSTKVRFNFPGGSRWTLSDDTLDISSIMAETREFTINGLIENFYLDNKANGHAWAVTCETDTLEAEDLCVATGQ
jgi:hypothetical protein